MYLLNSITNWARSILFNLKNVENEFVLILIENIILSMDTLLQFYPKYYNKILMFVQDKR